MSGLPIRVVFIYRIYSLCVGSENIVFRIVVFIRRKRYYVRCREHSQADFYFLIRLFHNAPPKLTDLGRHYHHAFASAQRYLKRLIAYVHFRCYAAAIDNRFRYVLCKVERNRLRSIFLANIVA